MKMSINRVLFVVVGLPTEARSPDSLEAVLWGVSFPLFIETQKFIL